MKFANRWSLVISRSVKQTPIIIAILTGIFTCHDRNCRIVKPASRSLHRFPGIAEQILLQRSPMRLGKVVSWVSDAK
jgi:hypothetical protein